ncbi:MAG TPA: hypothetical protein VMT10_00505 [Solirubrobacteraceae bacterium]|nr:hypothetical protein [Solirubrobacteraceae bacterium]
MADAALFVGWGESIHGREGLGLQVFAETLAYYTSLQEEGRIESFEPVLLAPHGGGLEGFIVLRGERATLDEIRASDEFERLTLKAQLVVREVGVVNALIGDGLSHGIELYQEALGAAAI